MSNVFTYAIDEQNLKIKLKALQAPMREDAWQKFEMYADAHPFQMPSTGFSGLNINLNRNVVLPVVFGLIICLFSFMLFNFISIKDSPANNFQKAEHVTPSAPEFKEVVIPMPQSLPAKNESVKMEPFIKPSAPAPVVEKPVFALPSEIGSTNNMTAEVPATATSIDQTVASTLEAKPETQKKSYRKSNKAEQQLMEIRPTPVSDEEEQEVIPN